MRTKISKIGITKDIISARGGLPLFLRYFAKVGGYQLLSTTISDKISSNNKGLQINQFLKQIIAFFIDGTDCTMSSFDNRKQDKSYSSLLENSKAQMASSHQVKRFFKKLSTINSLSFNLILHQLFIWRLKLEKPTVIYLGIDTMVMDNDRAKKKEGNELTYKKKKGFQPLQISWKSFLVDVLFRNGKTHSNHGTDFPDRIEAIVKLIREKYSKDVPIILRADSGFADDKVYTIFEEKLNIHYVITSKIYATAKRFLTELKEYSFNSYNKGDYVWMYSEIGSRLLEWKKYRRAIFTKLQYDRNGQLLMDFDKPSSLIYTNIGTSKIADTKLINAGYSHLFKAKQIIKLSHDRGADELIHRSIKELATKEQLPFKRFGMNRAYYFMLAFTHFIFEAYKRDISYDIEKTTIYPNTFRRKLIDFAVKIVNSSRYVTMKVTEAIYRKINIDQLWKRCQSPPQIIPS